MFFNTFVVVRDLTVLAQFRRPPEPVDVSKEGHRARVEVTDAMWGVDPYMRFPERWFDGAAWTDQVRAGDVVSTDPPGWRDEIDWD